MVKNNRSINFIYFLLQYISFRLTKNLFFFKVNGIKLSYKDSQSILFQFKEFFYDRSFKAVKLQKNDVILDVGANVGISSIAFRKFFPKNPIHSYEPDPEMFSCLQKNTQNLAISCNNLAVSNKTGLLSFQSFANDANHISKNGNIKVQSEKLSSLEKDSVIGLLKIDIEGHENELFGELDVLLKRTKYLMLEYHTKYDEPQKLAELLSILEKNNFRYYVESAYGRKEIFENDSYNFPFGFDLQVNIFARKIS